MRLPVLIAILAVAVPAGLPAGSASAQFFEGQSVLFGRPHGSIHEGRWCAREQTGADRIEENCVFDSFDACRRLVTQGNRGFCTENPAYAAGYGGPPRRKNKKKRRAY
jgi:hypothetical protein